MPRPVRALAFGWPIALVVFCAPGFPGSVLDALDLRAVASAAAGKLSMLTDEWETSSRISRIVDVSIPPLALLGVLAGMVLPFKEGPRALFRRIDPVAFLFGVVCAAACMRYPEYLACGVLTVRLAALSFRTTRRSRSGTSLATAMSLALIPYAAVLVTAEARDRLAHLGIGPSAHARVEGHMDTYRVPLPAGKALAEVLDEGVVVCPPSWSGLVQYLGRGKLSTYATLSVPAAPDKRSSLLLATMSVPGATSEPSVAAAVRRLEPDGFLGPAPTRALLSVSVAPPGYQEVLRTNTTLVLRRIPGQPLPPIAPLPPPPSRPPPSALR